MSFFLQCYLCFITFITSCTYNTISLNLQWVYSGLMNLSCVSVVLLATKAEVEKTYKILIDKSHLILFRSPMVRWFVLTSLCFLRARRCFERCSRRTIIPTRWSSSTEFGTTTSRPFSTSCTGEKSTSIRWPSWNFSTIFSFYKPYWFEPKRNLSNNKKCNRVEFHLSIIQLILI